MKLNVKDTQFLFGGAVVAQVRDGSVDLGEVTLIDTTTTTDETNTQVPGVRESMEGTITLVWDPALPTHSALMAAYLGKTKTAIGFAIRDNTPTAITTYSGDGYVINLSAPIAVQGGNGAMECSVKFKLAGKYTKS